MLLLELVLLLATTSTSIGYLLYWLLVLLLQLVLLLATGASIGYWCFYHLLVLLLATGASIGLVLLLAWCFYWPGASISLVLLLSVFTTCHSGRGSLLLVAIVTVFYIMKE